MDSVAWIDFERWDAGNHTHGPHPEERAPARVSKDGHGRNSIHVVPARDLSAAARHFVSA